MVQRLFQWLGAVEHGDIFTMCLTQRVKAGRSLKDSRAALAVREREYLDCLRDRGMISAASCSHIVWSQSSQGWHFHAHLLIEMPKGAIDAEWLLSLWKDVGGPDVQLSTREQSSLVVGAGPADPALLTENSCLDFWTESKGGLAKAVQYPVRDIAQGFTAEKLGGDPRRVAECVAVLLKHAVGWKLRRTYGQWRKKAPVVAVAAETKSDQTASTASAAPGPAPMRLGAVHRLARAARQGDSHAREIFRQLERSIRNDTLFGKRFVALCRLCWEKPSS